MPPTTRSKTQRYRLRPGPRPSFDALVYPHLVDKIFEYLPRQDLLVFRTVSWAYRRHAERLLFRRLVVRPGKYDYKPHEDNFWHSKDNPPVERPIRIQMPDGRGPVLPWRPDRTAGAASASTKRNVSHLTQIRQLCRVLDVERTIRISTTYHPVLAVKSLPNVHTLRRFDRDSFTFAVDTIIDFAGVSAFELSQLEVRCNRYVATGLDIVPFDRSEDKTLFTTNNLRLSGLKGLGEVVLLFKRQHWVEVVVSFLIRHQRMFKEVEFTIVGLAGYSIIGDSGETALADFKQFFLKDFKTPSEEILVAVTFMSHTKYRETVGEKQYLLETEKTACFM